jgi:dTDP-4-amino-4,6-dideoxygalactose transaminase
LDLQEGDEVILPPYTFVATVNAFVRMGAKPVFVDVRSDTLNIDETKIEAAITSRTKAIVPVHYAGVGCEMDAIMELARSRNIPVIEDAAQGLDAYYRSRPLGTFGELSIYSFHEAKNVTAGQAGAVCVNVKEFIERAEILRDKGTNRRKFFRGEVPKYEWVDIGVGHALSEIIAAFLYAQLESMDKIAERRRHQVETYRTLLDPLERAGHFESFRPPSHCTTNNHIFYLMLRSEAERDQLISHARSRGVAIAFHYTPLHASPMGQRWGYQAGDFPVTEQIASRLARLPLYHDLTENDQHRVCEVVRSFFK